MDNRLTFRFHQLQKSFGVLKSALTKDLDDEVIRAGIVQIFNITFDLSWKCMKDYLEMEGYEKLHAPRPVIQTAFENELIADGHLWITMLQLRNTLTHSYDEALVTEAIQSIANTYMEPIASLLLFFSKRQ